ncbi:MAG: hypothetical protein GQ558_06445 [Thermoplasmata archaeon]|nr:hypothetical protein [Thermoplasmata archaeon]
MKSAALAIVVVLLMANVIMYPYWTAQQDNDDDWNPDDGPNGEDIVSIDAISVTVPPVRSGDILLYDYEFLAEIYSLNTTSGNWSIIKLEANGQLLEQLNGPLSQKDGYLVTHESWQLHTELSLTVKITIEEHNEGEDSEPLIVNGRIQVDRDRFATLKGDVAILNSVDGLLAVDEVSGLEIPISNLEFGVKNKGYMDPLVEVDRPLEEQLYGDGNTLTEGDNGTYGEENPDWNYTQWYNWSMDRSDRVRGYDCARLNISLDFFGFMTLDKLIWLSSSVPRPVKIMYYSYTGWTDPNETGYILLSTSQTLTKDGYTKGGAEIPINRQAKENFVDRSLTADFREWEIAPQDGSISSSSFDLGLEEAVEVALAESSGLNDWMETHPSPLVSEASYWANQTDLRTMEYTWNITFADEMGEWDDWEVWYPTNAYQVNVTKQVITRPALGDLVETFIASERGPWYGYAPIPENDMADQLLTLASSEDIWANVQEIADAAYSGFGQDEVDFTDAWYSYSTGGLDVAGGFGMELLDTLAGISIPNTRVSYIMQFGNVWEGADTTAVAVDAETGRMVYIMQVEGPQGLALLFGAGD